MKKKRVQHLLRLLFKKDELIAAKDEQIAKLQHDLMAIPHELNLQRQLNEKRQEVRDLEQQLNEEIGAKNAALKELEKLKRERQQ